MDSIDSEIIQAASSRGQWDAAFDMSGAKVTALSPDEKTGTSFPFRITFDGVFVLSVSVIDACDKDSPQRSLFLTANTAESRWDCAPPCFILRFQRRETNYTSDSTMLYSRVDTCAEDLFSINLLVLAGRSGSITASAPPEPFPGQTSSRSRLWGRGSGERFFSFARHLGQSRDELQRTRV